MMTTKRVSRWAVAGLILGFLLPYAVRVGSIVPVADRIGDMRFYSSGGLQRWHERSGFATVVAYAVGVVLFINCWIALRPRRPASDEIPRLMAGFAAFAVVQFLLVAAVGAVVYFRAGGIM